jgi:hypothetical protein
MTLEQCRAALRSAPRDNQLSAVEPNVTRNVLFRLTCQALEKLPPHTIDVSPALAHHVACVAQDTIAPVPMRFIFDKDGVLVAGWNREQQHGNANGKPGSTGSNGSYLSYPHLMLMPIQTSYEQRVKQAIADDIASLAARAKAASGLALAKDIQDARDSNDRKNKEAAKPPDPTSPKFVLKRPKV